VNSIRTATGRADVNNYNLASLAVAEEMARLMKGGVSSEKEADAWLDKFKVAQSPAQRQGAITEAAALIRGRIESKRHRWNAVMGQKNAEQFNDFLSPHAQSLFGGHDAPANQSGGSPAADPLGIR
jgi:hypothetical protein